MDKLDGDDDDDDDDGDGDGDGDDDDDDGDDDDDDGDGDDGDGDDDDQQWWSTMMINNDDQQWWWCCICAVYVTCLSPEEVWALQVQKLTRKGMATLREKKHIWNHLKKYAVSLKRMFLRKKWLQQYMAKHDPFINRRLLQIISNPKGLRNLSTISLSISHVQPGKVTHSDSETGSKVGIAS